MMLFPLTQPIAVAPVFGGVQAHTARRLIDAVSANVQQAPTVIQEPSSWITPPRRM
jgi:hypothetical protein